MSPRFCKYIYLQWISELGGLFASILWLKLVMGQGAGTSHPFYLAKGFVAILRSFHNKSHEWFVELAGNHLRSMPVRGIAAGAQSSMALSIGGHVFCWGCNGRGRLGLGPAYDQEHMGHHVAVGTWWDHFTIFFWLGGGSISCHVGWQVSNCQFVPALWGAYSLSACCSTKPSRCGQGHCCWWSTFRRYFAQRPTVPSRRQSIRTAGTIKERCGLDQHFLWTPLPRLHIESPCHGVCWRFFLFLTLFYVFSSIVTFHLRLPLNGCRDFPIWGHHDWRTVFFKNNGDIVYTSYFLWAQIFRVNIRLVTSLFVCTREASPIKMPSIFLGSIPDFATNQKQKKQKTNKTHPKLTSRPFATEVRYP